MKSTAKHSYKFNQFNQKKSKHIVKFTKLNNNYLTKLLLNDFDKEDILEYQNVLSEFIDRFYNDDDFQLYSNFPKVFLQGKNVTDILNVLASQLCFNIIDLLSVYLDKFNLFTAQKTLADIITKEIVIKLKIFNKNIKQVFNGEYIYVNE